MTAQERICAFRSAQFKLEKVIEDNFFKDIIGSIITGENINSKDTPAYTDWLVCVLDDDTFPNAHPDSMLHWKPTNDDRPDVYTFTVCIKDYVYVQFVKYKDSITVVPTRDKNYDIQYEKLLDVIDYKIKLYREAADNLQDEADKENNEMLGNRLLEIRCDEELKELESLQQEKDIERAHIKADALLILILEKLGYNKVVELWEKIPK